MDRKLLDYLPDALRPYRELRAIAAGQQVLFEALWQSLDRALDDQFIATADDYALTRWERMLGIYARGTETLDARRARVLARLCEQLPFTLRTLRVQLEALCGAGGFTIELFSGNNALRVRAPLALRNYQDDIRDLLERVVPCALWIDFDLERNPHRKLANFTHASLARYTHENLENEVIKLA